MKFRSAAALSLCAICGANLASAHALSCQMAQECYETEACTDSGFSFEISAQEGGINVVTDYETYALTALSGSSPDTNVRSYVGRTSGAVHLLSVMDNAQARYMLHTTDGLAQVSYAGTCEVIK